MEIKKMLCHRGNYGSRRDVRDIKYIVLHYTGNRRDRAVNNCRYFQSANRNASAHYFVDEQEIYQSVEDDWVAWSVGGKKYSSCAYTGGGTFYGKCTNSNSVSIEMCNSVDGVPEQTQRHVRWLIQILMARYGVPKERIIRHFDVVGKLCPHPVIQSGEWQRFKQSLLEAERVEYSEVKVDVELFGEHRVVDAICKEGFNYVLLRELEHDLFRVGWNGRNILINGRAFIPDDTDVLCLENRHYVRVRALDMVKVDWDSKREIIIIY